MKRLAFPLLLTLCPSITGCGDADLVDSAAPVPVAVSLEPTTPAAQPPAASAEPATDNGASENPVTFLDSEALRQGTGAMDTDAPKEFLKTDSGLRYRVLRKSDGKMPTADQSVTVNYRGWLDNGNEFDSSYKRGESTSFPLNGVIRGWTEGLQLVGVGGMIELWIGPDLGYGASGAGEAVPPNATLHFIVELLEIQ